MNSRRNFIKNSTVASAALGIAPHLAEKAFATNSGLPPTKPFAGIQIAAHSFYDEGMDYCLDLLQEKAALNNVMVSFHAYYGAIGRPKQVMGDHGVPKPDNSKRNCCCEPEIRSGKQSSIFTGHKCFKKTIK